MCKQLDEALDKCAPKGAPAIIHHSKSVGSSILSYIFIAARTLVALEDTGCRSRAHAPTRAPVVLTPIVHNFRLRLHAMPSPRKRPKRQPFDPTYCTYRSVLNGNYLLYSDLLPSATSTRLRSAIAHAALLVVNQRTVARLYAKRNDRTVAITRACGCTIPHITLQSQTSFLGACDTDI